MIKSGFIVPFHNFCLQNLKKLFGNRLPLTEGNIWRLFKTLHFILTFFIAFVKLYIKNYTVFVDICTLCTIFLDFFLRSKINKLFLFQWIFDKNYVIITLLLPRYWFILIFDKGIDKHMDDQRLVLFAAKSAVFCYFFHEASAIFRIDGALLIFVFLNV